MKVPVHAQNFKKTYEIFFSSIKDKYDLTMNEVIVLLYLEKNKVKNTAKDMLNVILSSKSHISKSIDLLVKKEIIKTISDVSDKKINRLKIIPEKQYIIDDILKANTKMTNEIIKGLTKEDIEHFKYCLEVVERNMRNIYEKNNN